MDAMIYIIDGCAACEEAVDYLKKRKVPLTVINVTNSRDAWCELLRLGGIATPLLVIGDKVMHAFDPQKVDFLLKDT